MACRNGGASRDEVKNRDAASRAVGDALLFTTMCIIGMPVDVYAKDGSVYSGIFHTASLDKKYAIVLKKARMVEKGNLDDSVMDGALIETLIVQSKDLVQVVAKGVLLPSNRMGGLAGNGTIQAAADTCPENDVEAINENESKGYKKDTSQRSSTAEAANHLNSSSEDFFERLDTTKFVKIEAHNISVDRRNVEDGNSLDLLCKIQKSPGSGDMNGVQGTNLSLSSGKAPSTNVNLHRTMQQEPTAVSLFCSAAAEDRSQCWPTLDETAYSVASQPNVSVISSRMIDATSGSCLKASSNPFFFVPPKSSSVKRTVKDSKLNPGAKIFSPSTLHHRTVNPAVPNGASGGPYMASYTMAAPPQESVASSFTHSSTPVKLVPYNNVAVGHGDHDAAYVQPIIGQVVDRMQPTRITGQYQNFPMGPAYAPPNLQNVTHGRINPLACMRPMPTDVLQSPTGFAPATARPIFAKNQGNALAQTLQLCVSPQIMANGLQQFVMPVTAPFSQPAYPILQPINIPGTNNFLSPKFA
ncbi:uncharacterized protein LOC127266094 isoform X2 [Andrographis paniculata]|uniref:uncharacterized protein LOC127266094 isoform X2 n=1 Tax=Andrographis paniculata TaxID=175694 RepID=UPI0021E816E2|nr:uncharacterized protein LOC127266094 isoform X2 [Andrographis paniculata]